MCDEKLLANFGARRRVNRRERTADSPVHDPGQAERAWNCMRALFDEALPGDA